MNAIAAHKHELERLLVNLSHETAVSGMSFAVLVDAYLRCLDRNCSDITARVSASPARMNGESELTLTQNCALYYLQHKTTEQGAAFSRRFRAAALKRGPLSHSVHPTSFSGFYRQHRENGR
jgi:hypothetical protein